MVSSPIITYLRFVGLVMAQISFMYWVWETSSSDQCLSQIGINCVVRTKKRHMYFVSVLFGMMEKSTPSVCWPY